LPFIGSLSGRAAALAPGVVWRRCNHKRNILQYHMLGRHGTPAGMTGLESHGDKRGIVGTKSKAENKSCIFCCSRLRPPVDRVGFGRYTLADRVATMGNPNASCGG